MALAEILLLALLSIAAGATKKWRPWLLLLLSILAVYIFQPALPIRGLDYWLPTFTITICMMVWAATHPSTAKIRSMDGKTFLFVFLVILLIGLNRYLPQICCLTPTQPPSFSNVISGVTFGILLIGCAWVLRRKTIWLINGLTFLILGLFVLLKSPDLSQHLSSNLRLMVGQRADLATAVDIQWLGFSYIAFRLIHLLRDRLAGRMPETSLREMITYVIFYPALPAGPIDRIQRFTSNERISSDFNWENFWQASQRFLWGVFKKFALADSLALIALNDQLASQVQSQFWSWVILYSYAMRIYLDFSGYTDIALGLGQWLGISLPENFNRPYFKPNLTQFWNAWHITLAQWFRAYFFNPLARWMRAHWTRLPESVMILIAQTSTMLLIGLWHGVTLNFAIWGLWHGAGLFLHNRWNVIVQPRLASVEATIWGKRLLFTAGTIITFHFVVLGWVWFALPDPGNSIVLLKTLFGIIRN
jgi:alginate O-acetyltransferase complex protein AlgI